MFSGISNELIYAAKPHTGNLHQYNNKKLERIEKDKIVLFTAAKVEINNLKAIRCMENLIFY